MATLVAPLASGISAAASGTAYFYVYGTSYQTAAVAYDVDGVALGTSVALDAYGGRECYVDERVQVRVEDSSGVVVRTFAVQVDDGSTTIASQSFTGTDPDTGSQVSGGIALLRTVLDRLYTSFGARDFKVRRSGSTSDEYLKDALNPNTDNFFNVQAAAYGALGNGSNDDTAEIQAAIDAAVLAGGGIVYFPEGTYVISASLTVSSQKVKLLGAGHRVSVIRNDSTSGGAITISSGSTADCGIVIEDLAVVANTTSTGVGIHASVCNGLELRNVRVAGHSTAVKADSRVRILGGTYSTNTSGNVFCVNILSTGTGDGSEIRGAQLTMSSTDADQIAIQVQRPDVRIENNTIDTSAGAATAKGIAINNAAAVCTVVSGNRFIAGSGNYGLYITVNVGFYELGNRASSGTLFGATSTLTTASPQVRLSRDGASASASQSGGTANLNQDVAYHFIENTNAGGGTITLAASGGTPTHGARMIVTVRNSGGGGAQTVTAGTDLSPNGASLGVSLSAGQACTFMWIYNAHASIASYRWHQVAGEVSHVS